MNTNTRFTFRPRGGVWGFNDGREPFGLTQAPGALMWRKTNHIGSHWNRDG